MTVWWQRLPRTLYPESENIPLTVTRAGSRVSFTVYVFEMLVEKLKMPEITPSF
jgi:hypothetical protein